VPVAMVLSLSGCASASRGGDDLVFTVRGEVAPQLVHELRTDAHLKGRSFVFASYRDGRPRAEMDELTRDVRRELVEACLPHPEIRLRRRHPITPPDQPHRPAELDCGDLSTDIDMLVGIELRSGDRGSWELVLTADKTDGSRLPLLIRHPFLPSDLELDRLQRVGSADDLVGTRVLPFEGASDEMARHLARNLSCAGTLYGDGVYLETSNIGCSFEREVLAMTASYLHQYTMAEIVTAPADDVVELRASSYGDAGVRMLWLEGPDGLSARAHYTTPEGMPCLETPGSEPSDLVAVGVASWTEQRGSSATIQKRRAVIAAEVDAKRQLLERIGPVTVEGSVTVEDLLLTGELTRQWVSGVVRTVNVGEPRYDDDEGTVAVTLRLDRSHLVEALRSEVEGGP